MGHRSCVDGDGRRLYPMPSWPASAPMDPGLTGPTGMQRHIMEAYSKQAEHASNTPRSTVRGCCCCCCCSLACSAQAAANAGRTCSPDSIAAAGCQYYRFRVGVAWGRGGYVGLLTYWSAMSAEDSRGLPINQSRAFDRIRETYKESSIQD